MVLEGLGFRGGSVEKMRRIWLGLNTVVAGLPTLVEVKWLNKFVKSRGEQIHCLNRLQN